MLISQLSVTGNLYFLGRSSNWKNLNTSTPFLFTLSPSAGFAGPSSVEYVRLYSACGRFFFIIGILERLLTELVASSRSWFSV